jgi:hypothetical protein
MPRRKRKRHEASENIFDLCASRPIQRHGFGAIPKFQPDFSHDPLGGGLNGAKAFFAQ